MNRDLAHPKPAQSGLYHRTGIWRCSASSLSSC